MAKGRMREQMPVTAAFIDDLREGFGAAYIDSIIKAAMLGEPVFYSSENGHKVGTQMPATVRVGKDERGNACLLDGQQEPQEQEISKYETRMRREKIQGVKR